MARSDKWKLKSWYNVMAPKVFGDKKVGSVVGDEDGKVIHRKIITNLGEMTGEMPHSYTRLILRINEIKGKTAYTKLIGHELIRSYVRTIARRRMSLVDDVIKVKTKDGVELYVKLAVVTSAKISRPIRTAIRNKTREIVLEKAGKENFDFFIQEVLFKKLSSLIYNQVKEIAPIKRVEVIKTSVVEGKLE